jgi:quercetin dioxygenase-like cupin family protein
MNTTTQIINEGHSIAAGEGERLWIVGDTMTLKATEDTTGGNLVLVENLTAPGGGPPPHIHTREDEFWYVLDGTFEIMIAGEVHSLGPGGFAYAPRGTVHNFRNTADTPSRILVGFTPGGMGAFFRDSGQPATDDGPAPPFDEAELARTRVAAEKRGLVLVTPDA